MSILLMLQPQQTLLLHSASDPMEAVIAAALEAGAHKAELLSGKDIVLSAGFREICRNNQCGKYGKCWVCPPELPPVETVMEKIRSYPHALWYQSVSPLEDSFDIEGMMEAGRNHALLSLRLQKLVAPLVGTDFLHLSCGGCHLCDTCAKAEGQPCRMPEKALPSLEGYCVDVYNTTKNTSLRYINGQNTVTYFGMLMF